MHARAHTHIGQLSINNNKKKPLLKEILSIYTFLCSYTFILRSDSNRFESCHRVVPNSALDRGKYNLGQFDGETSKTKRTLYGLCCRWSGLTAHACDFYIHSSTNIEDTVVKMAGSTKESYFWGYAGQFFISKKPLRKQKSSTKPSWLSSPMLWLRFHL